MQPTKAVSPEAYALTALQQGMLFHSLAAPQQGVYVQQLIVELRESLDVANFVRAWEQLVDRHPVLRTSFGWQDRETVQQIVHPAVTLPWQTHDLSHRSPPEQEKELEDWLRLDRHRGFEFATPPLFRLSLFRLGEVHYRLVWTSHHAILDGRSLLILLEELYEFYDVSPSGLIPQLVPPTPFRDFVDWLQAQDFAASEPFWRKLLANYQEPTLLALGPASPGDVAQPLTINRIRNRLPSSLSARLRCLATDQGLTLNTLAQGAWAILLSRYVGRQQVVFGATRAGRHSGPLSASQAVGLLINTVPLPVDVAPNARLLPWLQQLRALWVALRPHEHTPLVQTQRWSPSSASAPLFNTLVVCENYELNARLRKRGPAWQHRTFDLRSPTNYPLVLNVRNDEELVLEIEYHTPTFSRDAVDRMLGHLQTLLGAIVAEPDRTIGELPLLTTAERHQLLVQWNDTAVRYPHDMCVHELFEQQVEQTPEAVAVVFEDRQLTYRELNCQANQLAHYLRSCGLGPDRLVCIYLECSLEMMVGLLSVLKAGGAYVPLDPTNPRERSQFMFRDSAAEIVLTQEHLLGHLPGSGAQVICLDRDNLQISRESTSNLASGVTADHLAYVIYTSGSTGQPKGVLIRHRGLVNYLTWCTQAYAVTEGDGAPVHSSLAFDLTVTSLYAPLLVGRTVDLLRESATDIVSLSHALSRHSNYSFVKLTPAHLDLLGSQLASATAHGYPRAFIIGGENLTGEKLAVWQQHAPETALFNEYGPTETVVGCCVYRVPPGQRVTGSVPIGRPIANTQVYVLDPQRQLVPIGVPGELYLAGAGLARGYLHRPQLTAEKFVPHPFNADPAARLYRTGDQVRWRADGNLEFLGRLDDQIKLRGFRIELGEIEAALQEHPAVRQCVVALREDRPGEKRLVGYYVRSGERPVSHAELTHYLREQIPDYMVPASWVELPQLPLTSSGKLDRRALPAPDQTRPELDTAYTPPRTGLEEQLSAIWCEVLGLERVGSHDDFFALGGHSLLATRVMARVSAVLQVELPLRRLFELPTIAQLAAEISARRSGETPPPSRALVRRKREPLERLPLSFGQQRLWFLEQVEGALTAYNIPFAWRIHGPLNEEALRQAFEIIVARHEPLRTTFTLDEGVPRQVIQASARFELPVVDLGGLAPPQQEAEITERCRAEAERPFDLTRDRMLRAALLRLSADEQVLLVTLHHIASDGWSVQVLWQELNVLYQTEGCRADTLFGELPLHYADYAAWQRQALAGPRLATLRQYWRQQLAGVRALELPTDHPRPPQSTYRGARHDFTLGSELVQQLRSLSQTAGVTLHMTLLATFQTLLSRYSGQDDIAVATPTAGRQHVEWEPLIGFFVNTLVLRTDLSGDPTFRELLARVRQVALAAYDHQDLPFEQLVEELQPERHLNRNPLADVLFQWLSFGDQDLALQGVTVSRLPPASSPARFDLELHLWQQRESHHGTVIYSTDLFDPSTIGRLVGHYLTLLAGIVADPDRHLSELPWLTEPERQQLLVSWNDTAVEYPRDRCVQELFEEQVARTPDAVAVSFADQQLSYRELNARANQLAHHLRSLGVGPEVLVGLCLERAPEMIIGLLGILKAGGAYLPLDMEDPPARLEFMLRDAAVPYLVTRQSLRERLPPAEYRAICLDTAAPQLEAYPATNLPADVAAEHLAYVIYTSGSTGQPKGVQIQHRALVNRLLWMVQTYGFSSADRIVQKTPFSFDVAGWEFFCPLLCGARLVFLPPGKHKDPVYLRDFLQREEITLVHFVPSMLEAFLQVDGLEQCPSVKQVFSSGEALSVGHVARFFQQRGGVRLHNLYGPTEAAIEVTCWECQPQPDSVPIGHPIANTQVYVLDPQQQLVPIGVPGELYIGGVQVARGYLHRPQLTAEKFVPHPFDADPAARLYRTGDLVRWRADGNLEFLGRQDEQVKLRGYRIELGEIESVLKQHPAVAQSVVMLREDRPDDKRLVGYYVRSGERPVSHAELTHYLREQIPDYMVPASWVELPQLPLTPSGKADRRALPAPEELRPELATAYEPPRNALEAQLAAIWADVLGLERVGVHDNFFALGGHSLLAMQAVSKASIACPVDVPLRAMFESPTVADLSRVITSLRESSAGVKSSPINRLDRAAHRQYRPSLD